ncbi:MAG: glycosyltransferase family 2 protein, partial [Deferribacteraceae bacterium]|nr:glycosyltransferase family 2 protein [Deferribacteraceae bacterium]
MITVSAIIPCYNRPQLVKAAIESIFCQHDISPAEIEIIVVDDGSKPCLDLSAYIPRISLIRQNNMGVSAARNAGVNAAQGEFIAFLDSDDIWLADKLAQQLGFMQKHGALVSHTDELWLRQGRWVNQGRQHQRYGGDILCKILDKCRVSPSSLMVRKDFFKAIGGFDEQLRVCEDYELCLRMAAQTKIYYLEERLLVKRAIDASLSQSIQHIESIRLTILERFAAAGGYEPCYSECIEAELEPKR